MKELERPGPFNVEEIFNQFVCEQGGKLVSNLIQKNIDKPNADYFFTQPNVIAELKCFKKDLFNNEEDIERLFELFKQWKKKGLISQSDEIKLIFRTKQLPRECYLDLIKKCSKTIERAIHHANKQIRETKKLLSVTDAKGLVLLANDGNYFLQHNIFIALIADIMHRKFLNSEIDGFVYFTVNQVASMPNSPLDWNLWTPAYRQQNDDLLGSFVNRLGDSFLNNFYTKLTGIPPTEKIVTNNLEKGFDVLKQLKHLPKNIAFKKKSNQ